MTDYSNFLPTFHVPPSQLTREYLLDEMRELNATAAANLASEFCHRLAVWIRDFEGSLDDQHEVGVRLVSFGQTTVFHLESVNCFDPSLIAFRGVTNSGDPVELIQHVSQISILLMKMKRIDPLKPKKPIGFSVENGASYDQGEEDQGNDFDG